MNSSAETVLGKDEGCEPEDKAPWAPLLSMLLNERTGGPDALFLSLVLLFFYLVISPCWLGKMCDNDDDEDDI